MSWLFSPVLYLRQLADYSGGFYNQKKDFRRDQRLEGPQAQSERASEEEKCVKDACAARTRCTAAISGTFPTLAPWLFPAVSLFSIAQLNLLCLWSPIYSGPTASVCRMRCSQCGSGSASDEYDSCQNTVDGFNEPHVNRLSLENNTVLDVFFLHADSGPLFLKHSTEEFISKRGKG